MAKKPRLKKVETAYPQAASLMQNALGDAILGFPSSYQGIGTQINQATTLFINNRWYLVSNMRQLLSEMFVEHGVIQTMIKLPVDDGLRGGVKIKCKQLKNSDVEDLQNEIERRDDISMVAETLYWNRLYGGAAILSITEQDPVKPLDLKRLYGRELDFRAIDMWELFYSRMNTGDYAASIDTSEITNVKNYNYYGQLVDASRVMRMVGLTAPSFIRPRLQGWGMSIVECVVASLNQYLKNNNLVFEVLDEFKIDVYRFKNLTSTMMSAGGEAKVRARVTKTNEGKNYNHAIIMDSEDEYQQKQLTFTGLAEIMKQIQIQIACDLRIPMTKLFGMSASGFNSGEDDIENYNSMVEATVRSKCKYDILKVLELRCMQMFGFIPDDLSIEFTPLRVMSSTDEETVKTQKFQRVLQARTTGEITSAEFRESCNVDNLLPIQLDAVDADLLESQSPNQAKDSNPKKDESEKTDEEETYDTTDSEGGDDSAEDSGY